MIDKKKWQAPKVEELAVQATLGGSTEFVLEAVVFNGGPQEGQPVGTQF